MTTATTARGILTQRTPIQMAAIAFGIIFLVVGVAGFLPGVTTDYDRLGVFGGVAAKVLGLFGVNWLENIAHLGFGVAGLALARSAKTAWQYFVVGGLVYAVLSVYGFAIDIHGTANILGVNEAGNWLHAVLALGMTGIGVALGRDVRARS